MNEHTHNPPVFHDADFPNGASHCPQSECGFSIYRDVLIQWDEDNDKRVLILIDQMPADVREELLIAQEHKASVSLVWKNHIPSGWNEGRELSVEEDIWQIMESSMPRTIHKIPERPDVSGFF